MANVLLIIHLILALAIVAVVLLQRSEGGALGIGGGGGGINASRPPGTPLGKVTWVLAAAFIATSLTLTILAARDGGSRSVLDRLDGVPGDAIPLVPPPADDDGTLAPGLEQLLAPLPGAPAPGGPAAPATPSPFPPAAD